MSLKKKLIHFTIPLIKGLLKIENLNDVDFKLCTHDFGLITGGDLPSCQDTHKIFIIKDAKNQVVVLIFLFKEEEGRFIPITPQDYPRYQCHQKANKDRCSKKCNLIGRELISTYQLNGTNFTYFTRTLQDFIDSKLVTLPTNLTFYEDVNQSSQMLNEQLMQIIQPPQPTVVNAPRLSNTPIGNVSNTSRQSTVVNAGPIPNVSNISRSSILAERSSNANVFNMPNINGKSIRISSILMSNSPSMDTILNILKTENPFMYQFIQIGIIYGFTIDIIYYNYTYMEVLNRLTFVIFDPSKMFKTEIRYTPFDQYIRTNPQSTMINLYSYLDSQRKVQKLRQPVSGGKKKSKRKTTPKKKKVSKK